MTHSPAHPTPVPATPVLVRDGLRAHAPAAARRTVALTTLLALAATLLVATGQPARAAGISSRDASQFHQRVNGERDSRGLGRLAGHAEITGIAQSHSRTMARNAEGRCSMDTIYHRKPIDKGIDAPWTLLAENVGCYRNDGMSYSQTVDELHRMLMESDGHRRNILNQQVRYVGIGAFRDDHGGVWVTQIFMDMQETSSPAPEPKPQPKPSPSTSPTTSESSSHTHAEPAPEPTPRPETRRAQRRLAALGFYTGPVDGLYGPGTTRAVRAFQTAAGLTVDGILGPRTSQALYADDAPRKGEPKAQPEPKPQPKTQPTNEATPAPAQAGPSRAVPPLGPEHMPGGLTVIVASTGMIGSVTDVPAAMDRVRGLLDLLFSALRSLGA